LPKLKAFGGDSCHEVIKRFPRKRTIQGFGILFLNVAANSKYSYKREICNNGGVNTLSSAIRNFMDVETFVEQSLHELSSLSMFAPSTIAKEVSIVRKAAERYLQRAEIQLAACSIFALLTTRMGIAD
jgi:hypothetical protein